MNKELAILEYLSKHDKAYGLDIAKHLDKTIGGSHRGAVYVTLDRLEDERYIKSEMVPAPTSQNQESTRRVYSLDHGKGGERLRELKDAQDRFNIGGLEGGLSPN